MEAFQKELANQLSQTMDVQELQDYEKVSTIKVKNANSIVNKIKSTKLMMIDMKPKDAMKVDIVELDQSQTYPEEDALPEVGLYRYIISV